MASDFFSRKTLRDDNASCKLSEEETSEIDPDQFSSAEIVPVHTWFCNQEPFVRMAVSLVCSLSCIACVHMRSQF